MDLQAGRANEQNLIEQEKEDSVLCCSLCFGTPFSPHYQKNNSMKCRFSADFLQDLSTSGQHSFHRLPYPASFGERCSSSPPAASIPCAMNMHPEYVHGVTVSWLPIVSNPRKDYSFSAVWVVFSILQVATEVMLVQVFIWVKICQLKYIYF